MVDHIKEATDRLIRDSWGYVPEEMHPDDYKDAYDNVAAVAPYLMSKGRRWIAPWIYLAGLVGFAFGAMVIR